jgi:hypothetical protein
MMLLCLLLVAKTGDSTAKNSRLDRIFANNVINDVLTLEGVLSPLGEGHSAQK